MRLLSLLLIALAPVLSQASDADHGEELHQKHCVACHINLSSGDGSALYTRDARRVSSLNKLNAQVRFCEANLSLRWFDEEIEDVATYLNNNFYRFKKP